MQQRRLCRLLTLGKSRAGKEGRDITWADLVTLGEGLLLILLPDEVDIGRILLQGAATGGRRNQIVPGYAP